MKKIRMAYAPAGTVDHRRFYAQFAQAAYKPGQSTLHPGWEVDPELSNRNRQVFVNHTDKRSIVAFRGTNPKNHGDIGSDVLLALNMRDFSSRFNNAKKTARDTRKKYGDYHITYTGHSLGGSQASWVHGSLRDKNSSAVTFAAHEPTSNIQKKALENLAHSRTAKKTVTNYVTKFDPVSMGTLLSGNYTAVEQTSKGPHDLANYLA